MRIATHTRSKPNERSRAFAESSDSKSDVFDVFGEPTRQTLLTQRQGLVVQILGMSASIYTPTTQAFVAPRVPDIHGVGCPLSCNILARISHNLGGSVEMGPPATHGAWASARQRYGLVASLEQAVQDHLRGMALTVNGDPAVGRPR